MRGHSGEGGGAAGAHLDDGVSAVTQPDPAIVSLKDITGVAPIETEAVRTHTHTYTRQENLL